MARSEARPYWRDRDLYRSRASRSDVDWSSILGAGALCGSLGVLLFQEGTLALLHGPGQSLPGIVALFGMPPEPYRLAPGWLAGLPALMLKAGWGALWGIILATLIGRGDRLPAMLTGSVLGVAVLASIEIYVWPLVRSMSPPDLQTSHQVIATTLLAYAAWGWGTAGLLRLAIRR